MELVGSIAGLGKDAPSVFTVKAAIRPPSGSPYEEYSQFIHRWRRSESGWIIVCDKAEYDDVALMEQGCLGIITETGGILGHGSILLREQVMWAMKKERQYNKVVVVGVTDATKLLKDGSTIQISISIDDLKATIATV